MMLLLGTVLAVLLGSSPVTAGSLRDIEHVVIFMQENRAWDTVSLCLSSHYSKFDGDNQR